MNKSTKPPATRTETQLRRSNRIAARTALFGPVNYTDSPVSAPNVATPLAPTVANRPVRMSAAAPHTPSRPGAESNHSLALVNAATGPTTSTRRAANTRNPYRPRTPPAALPRTQRHIIMPEITNANELRGIVFIPPNNTAGLIQPKKKPISRPTGVATNKPEEDGEGCCPVCYDDEFKQPIKTKCGHKFCVGCIREALEYRPTCPLCRRPLRAEIDWVPVTTDKAPVASQ